VVRAFLCIAIAFALVGCTNRPEATTLKLTFNRSSIISNSVSAMTVTDPSGIWGVSNPTANSDIACVLILVDYPEQSMGGNCSSATEQQPFDAFGGLISTSGGSAALVVNSGAARQISILGFNAASAASCKDARINGLDPKSLSKPYLLYSGTHDLIPGEQTLKITATFDSSKSFDTCGGSGLSMGPPEILKLNGPLNVGGNVSSPTFSPDDNLIAFTSTEGGTQRHLYIMNKDGTGKKRISHSIAADKQIYSQILFTPDSQKVVYLVEQSYQPKTLHVVNVDGTGQIQINGTLLSGSIQNVKISPDGTKVFYRATQTNAGQTDLYVVNIDGTSNIKLNSGTSLGGMVSPTYHISSTGKVLYLADKATTNLRELYIVNFDSSGEAKLSQGGRVWDDQFFFSFDGSKVVYAEDPGGFLTRLWSINPDGTSRLNITGSVQTNCGISQTWVSPYNDWVVVWGDRDTDGKNEMYAVHASGGTVYKLNGTIAAGGSIDNAVQFVPGGNKVVLYGAVDSPGNRELYSVNLDGTSFVKLHPAITGVAWQEASQMVKFSTDGSKILFSAEVTADGVGDLFVVNSDGTGRVQLENGGTGNIYGFEFVQGGRVAYVNDETTPGVPEAYLVNLDGTNRRRISPPLVTNGSVSSIYASKTGTSLLFNGDVLTDNIWELFMFRL
jgi:Tol biopolymer transport system component